MDPRIFLLPLGAFAIGTGNIVFVGVLEPLANDLGVSIATAGQLATAFAVAYALSAPLLVSLTARLPRRPVLTISLLVFALANAGMALAPSFAALVPLRILAAFAAASVVPSETTATDVVQTGIPVTKLAVPSTGSITHAWPSSGTVLRSSASSPTTASSGNASAIVSATANPHGFACLITAADGASKSCTRRQAASASNTFR
jgi:MFS family permease